jgi:motility quorum-sensing regulator/GCU-specific mRNA interferase toxin
LVIIEVEKRTPHCPLAEVKRLAREGCISITYAALRGGDDLGLDRYGIVRVVLALTMRDFYKSTTTYEDHTTWQDVYRPTTEFGVLYVKLTVQEKVLVVSFKEL